ncbi:hypothetical protein ACFC1T_08860 [Kitasatospora sp. NPDC056076]|uniref:hypothetical protein n=1 Tax=Kitasatospora sp. NPDC056076 TaxID=3345703 RepID=UPI0035DBBB2C
MTDTPTTEKPSVGTAPADGFYDPDCTCSFWEPIGRIWCAHCRTDGPLPGSFADPAAYPSDLHA